MLLQVAKEAENIEKGNIDVSAIIQRFISHWWVFALIFPLFTFLAMWKVHFASNSYDLEAQILIRDSDNKSIGSENLIEGMQLFSAYSNIQNELGVLKSFQLHLRTIKKLDFEPTFYSQGQFKTKERYSSSPYKLTLDKSVPQLIAKSFFIHPVSDTKFELKVKAENGLRLFNYSSDEFTELKDSSINFQGEFFFGEKIVHPHFSFSIEHNIDLEDRYEDEQFYFRLNDYAKLAKKYKSLVKFRTLNKEASIIVINMEIEDRMKGITFINTLCQEYLNLGLEDKNKVASNTLKFINEQLSDISDSLTIAENQLQNFRLESKVMDLDFTSVTAFENLEKYQKEKVELLTQDKYYKYLLDYVTKTTVMDTLVAPSLMGINDQLLNNLLQELTLLYKERAGLGYNSEAKNPALQRLNAKIGKTKSSLIENVHGLISASEIQIKELEKSINRTMARVDELPENERNLINIERKFNLNDQLYKYLLQKRAEASIALASNVSDHKILDKAQMLGADPTPSAGGLTYGLYGVIGLLLSAAIVIIKGVVDDTVIGENHVKRNTGAPYIGAIAINKGKNSLPLLVDPSSPISESFRVVKTNLDHAINRTGKIILGITSMSAKEGKTFIASNLALAYALAGKKVVLLSTDLRKPDLHEYFKLDNTIGLSTYLNEKEEISGLLLKTPNENLDIIVSGPRAKYPAETLGANSFETLLTQLKKKYDLVLVDGTPLGVVSDYFMISSFMDVHVTIVRDEFSTKRNIEKLNELINSERIGKSLVLFNHYKKAITTKRSMIEVYYQFTNRKSIREIIKRKLKLSI